MILALLLNPCLDQIQWLEEDCTACPGQGTGQEGLEYRIGCYVHLGAEAVGQAPKTVRDRWLSLRVVTDNHQTKWQQPF